MKDNYHLFYYRCRTCKVTKFAQYRKLLRNGEYGEGEEASEIIFIVHPGILDFPLKSSREA
ncbi:hypothetical protein J6590_075457 [Homalodisca vitripennis]|nr:hypothetical protein J6590_075457 [Homalodisca vitripennis]